MSSRQPVGIALETKPDRLSWGAERVTCRGTSYPETTRLPTDPFYDKLVALRWPDGIRCQHCGSKRYYDYRKLKLFRCAEPSCRKNFSPTTGTVFQWRKLSPRQLLEAIDTFPLCSNASQFGRALGIEHRSAHYLWRRLTATGGKLA